MDKRREADNFKNVLKRDKLLEEKDISTKV
jgi:hypothetical protein